MLCCLVAHSFVCNITTGMCHIKLKKMQSPWRWYRTFLRNIGADVLHKSRKYHDSSGIDCENVKTYVLLTEYIVRVCHVISFISSEGRVGHAAPDLWDWRHISICRMSCNMHVLKSECHNAPLQCDVITEPGLIVLHTLYLFYCSCLGIHSSDSSTLVWMFIPYWNSARNCVNTVFNFRYLLTVGN